MTAENAQGPSEETPVENVPVDECTCDTYVGSYRRGDGVKACELCGRPL